MQAVLKALKDVRDELVPIYNTQLDQSKETLTQAIMLSGGKDVTLTFADTMTLMQLLSDMKSAVYMLEQNLSGNIVTLEISEIMNTPATLGRPKKGAEG